MSCEMPQDRASAHVDGELRGLRRFLFARHLRGCKVCQERVEQIAQLRARLHVSLPRHAAPEDLRRIIGTMVQSAPEPRARTHSSGKGTHRMPGWTLAAGGALAGCAVTLSVILVANQIAVRRNAEDVVAQMVANHVLATSNHHLIEVASSDQHTVKPWLSARLDYSPPVRDLADEGYSLVGARLDTLQGQNVATLVYQHRQHFIDVVVRPLPVPAPDRTRELRGFHVVHATGETMDYLAVSDMDEAGMEGFVARLASQP